MNCNESEHSILQSIDDPLPTPKRLELEAHLVRCASCRTKAEELERMDAALTRTLRAPALPSAFTRDLQVRIAAQAPAWSERELLERKRQVAREFEAAQAKLNRGRPSLGVLADLLGGVFLCGCAVWLVWKFSPVLIARFGLSDPGQAAAHSLLVSAIFICMALAVAFPAPFRRLWAELEA